MKIHTFKFKRAIITMMMATLIFAGFFGIPGFTDEAYAITEPPVVEGNGAVVIDARTGEILYNKNIDAQFEPASMTKMITCILTLENRKLTDIVTIDGETPFTGGSRIYLIEGENITVQNLLYALMLESANDSAVALAKEIGGSVPEFAKMMNEKAKELGCTNTNFVNPNGLHEEGHLSTAHDMALIAKYCMQNATFRELVTTYKYDIPPTNKQPETRHLYNTNRLLYDNKTKVNVNGVSRGCKYEGCTGIKTGYTPQAGGCLAAGTEKDGTELISVVMNSSDKGRFADTIALFDWTLANYRSKKVVEAGSEMESLAVKGGNSRKVALITEDNAYALLQIEDDEANLHTEVESLESIQAPFKAGTKAGVLKIYADEKLVGQTDLVTAEEVEEGGFFSKLEFTDSQAHSLFLVGGVLLVAFVAITVWINILKNRRKRERRRRREERALAIAKERAAREENERVESWFR